MYSITIQQRMDDRLGMYLIPLSVQRLMTWLILINRDSPIIDIHVVIICIWCGYNMASLKLIFWLAVLQITARSTCFQSYQYMYNGKEFLHAIECRGFFVEVICPSWQLISHSDGKLISDASDTVRPNFRYFYCSVAFSRFHLYFLDQFFLSLYSILLIF